MTSTRAISLSTLHFKLPGLVIAGAVAIMLNPAAALSISSDPLWGAARSAFGEPLAVLPTVPAVARCPLANPGGYAESPDPRERLEAAAAVQNEPWRREFMLELAKGKGAPTGAGRGDVESLPDLHTPRSAASGTRVPIPPGGLAAWKATLSGTSIVASRAGAASAGPLDGTWLIPRGRWGHSAIYDPVRDRMVVFGGGGRLLNDVWALSLSGDPTWTELTPFGTPPSGRFDHSAIYDPVRDRMVVFGGYGDNYDLNEVWALSLSGTPAWTELTPIGTPPSGRDDHSAIYDPLRDRMVVFGGDTLSFGDGDLNEVWALSLSGTPAWTELTPIGTPPSGRFAHSAIYDPMRDRMVVFGGYGDNYDLNDVWALSLSGTPAWTELTPTGALPSERDSHSAIYDPVRDRMVVFGGSGGGGLGNDVWALSLSGTPAWTELTPTGALPSERDSHSAIYDPVRDRMVVFGGSGNDVWALSLSGTPAWTGLIPAGTPPSARFDDNAIYDPVRDRMVVFGGRSGGSLVNDVWALSLSGTPEWIELTPAGTPPDARDRSSAIYDPVRDRMLIFGGLVDFEYVTNEVWALSLSGTVAWTTGFPILGAPPSGRFAHSAIYDPVRDRMVVFGGYTGGALVNDVWALSLSGTPAWTQLMPIGTPPSERWLHSAIYDPVRDRMVVFGGSGGGGLGNEVWALSLSGTPAWTELGPIGAPPNPRHTPSAIYDPLRDRMVVFGGYNDTYLNEVWALSLWGPTAWTELMPSGTPPSGRDDHNAIYDPVRDRMVVFGGYPTGNGLAVLEWGALLDQPPAIAAPGALSAAEGRLLVLNVSVSDPDGDAIGSLTAAPLPPRASFTPNSANTGGTLSWRPVLGEAGDYSVMFTAVNGRTSSATTTMSVTKAVCTPFAGFAPHVDYAAGSLPLGVAVADLNGDGRKDLAVASYSATVSILLGNGDGTFAPKTDFATGAGSYAIVIGDWNVDGKSDVAVANRDDSTISVLLGNGDGTFSAKTDYGAGAGPVSIASGDFNSDGRADLVTANIYASSTSVLLGNGDGSFGPKTDFGTGSQPFSVAVGDLTADGRLDLAVAPNNDTHANVLPGNGDGTFNPAIGLLIGPYPQAVVIGDWNGDGKQDLAVARGGANLVSVLLSDGSGAFGLSTDYETTGNAYALAAGDFDGDGRLDLIASNSNAGSISVLFGIGNGSFTDKTDFGTAGGTARVAVGDFNGDARPDVAVGSSSGSTVSVLLNLCSEITAVAEQVSPRPRFALLQNNPNPFNPTTVIRFELAESGPVRLYVFSPGGRLVAKLVDGAVSAGPHQVSWSGQDGRGGRLPSGVYYYRLEAGGFVSNRRMILLK